MLRASRCKIPGARNPGAWSQVPHPRCQILGVRFSGARLSCARLKVADPRCQILGARLQVPDSRCQSPGVRFVRMAFPKLLGTHSEVIRSVIKNDQFILIWGLLESVTESVTKSVASYRLFHPTCAHEVTKVSLLPSSPPVLRARSYQSVAISRFPHPPCALEVTKMSLLSCPRPAARPRSYQCLVIYLFSRRLAPSKLPKCRCFCALAVTKVLPFIVFPSDLRPGSYQSVAISFSPPDLRPRSYQSVPSLVFPIVLRPRSNQSVIVSQLFPFGSRIRGYQSVLTFVFNVSVFMDESMFSRLSMCLETIAGKNWLIELICEVFIQ